MCLSPVIWHISIFIVSLESKLDPSDQTVVIYIYCLLIVLCKFQDVIETSQYSSIHSLIFQYMCCRSEHIHSFFKFFFILQLLQHVLVCWLYSVSKINLGQIKWLAKKNRIQDSMHTDTIFVKFIGSTHIHVYAKMKSEGYVPNINS